MIVHSRIGHTDCSDCTFFRYGGSVLAKRLPGPDQNPEIQFVSLALRVAELPTEKLAKAAIDRIAHAIMRGDKSVRLQDLERLGDGR